MKKTVRILNIRKHKNVCFLDAYENLGTRLQLLISNILLDSVPLSKGSIISFEGFETVNNLGNSIIEISKIYYCNNAIEWTSPKGIHNHISSKNLLSFACSHH